ncbi:response regulator [Thalassotalea castellviae]|uniref:histidine kinase n=1 Tax=Thalassotalea castellviae TaxID=3075612 RepID=A0ABU2ZXE8_9GAMM|nr:response regulator [Thalassotalea sp. W431]MDT0602606.1 tetratricopeptide repeat protein [Thalassotalea sp. W431]
MLGYFQKTLLVFGLFIIVCSAHTEPYLEQSSQLSITQKISSIEAKTDQALILFELKELLTAFNLTNNERLDVLKAIEKNYQNTRDFINAIETVNRIILLTEQSDNSLDLAQAYKRLGIYHYLKGEYQQAIEHYHDALEIINRLNQPILIANMNNNIGLAQAALGQNIQAINSYQVAEKIYQEFGSELDRIDIRFNIAGLYLKLERYDTAIEAYLDVIERRKKIQDLSGLADAYSDLGIAYKQSNKAEIALEFMQKSLNYYLEKNDLFSLASIYHNIAEVYFELNQHDRVLTFAEESIAIAQENEYKTALSGALHTYAKGLYYLGNAEQSLSYLLQSQKIAEELNYAKQLLNNYSLFSLVYATLNQPANALKYHKLYILARNKRENDNFNLLLASYESEQLKQQVLQLKQNEQLQQLELSKTGQKRKFIIVAFGLLLLTAFFIYRRNAERRSKLELITKVKQRTKELELLADKLQAANKVKSLFLANMSHEIRTPLTAIIAQAEALIYDDIDEKTLHADINIIHSNSLHLLELINNILDLSKVEANKLDLDIQTQDLHCLLQDVSNMFTEQAKSKGLTFSVYHALPRPFVLPIDGIRIKQILINLCSNAVKFTSQGQVKVIVTIESQQLIFSVEDTGIGLSSSQINSLFESFTQGDSSISRRFGGTGLGLCLSQQLAQLMSGNIEISSVLNQGSTFTFILPISVELDNYQNRELELIQPAIEKDTVKENIENISGSILLAEDHQDNRKLISRLLRSLGLEVYTAKNGKEAVQKFLQYQPQVILLDIQMPEMDGIEAHTIMRQKGATQPIIALTANAMAHEVEEYLAQGFDDHLKKPIERKVFIQTICQYYQHKVCSDKVAETLNQVDFSDLVEQFKSNLALEQQDIILHIKNDDYEQLSQLVHRIAGAAQMFGFSALSQYALALETSLKNKDYERVTDQSQILLNEIDQVLW